MNELENNEEFTSEESTEESTAENPQQETAEQEAAEQNTEAENNSAENENNSAENAEQEENQNNTTYHYAYASANNQNAYYNPAPQQNTQYNPYYTAPIAEEPKKKNKTALTLIIVFCICAVLAIVGLFVAAAMDRNNSSSENTTKPTSPSAQVETKDQEDAPKKNDSGEYTVRGVVDKVIDSCVGITVYAEATNYSNFYGYGSQKNNSGEMIQSGAGSGVLMLEDKGKTYIITNAHVISDGSKFTVTLNDKKEYEATMVGYDSQTDIGVLSINKTGLQIAEFGKSDQTVQGEQVVAIGCPGGLDFLNSSSVGYVSALARPIQSTIGYNTECIQIDASINPGNSGGGLFNMQGQIIGINSSKIAATEYEGMGFAIPSNTAIATANSLIKVGYVEGRAKLGITYKSITSYSNANAIVNALNKLGFENAAGTMVINEVTADSDLIKKDIQPYDMIVAVNGKTMTSTDIMTSVLAKSKPGDKIKLTIARIKNNQIDTFEVECTLIESKG
ncbi:MAG: trypsin-like peptidase domain-containing protein [Eubacterium sp.]|nr:trypsin-like peptidase domain-containing protein [Eubacterium sp.]